MDTSINESSSSSNGSSRVPFLLEKLVDHVLGEYLTLDDRNVLLDKALRHFEEYACLISLY